MEKVKNLKFILLKCIHQAICKCLLFLLVCPGKSAVRRHPRGSVWSVIIHFGITLGYYGNNSSLYSAFALDKTCITLIMIMVLGLVAFSTSRIPKHFMRNSFINVLVL